MKNQNDEKATNIEDIISDNIKSYRLEHNIISNRTSITFHR